MTLTRDSLRRRLPVAIAFAPAVLLVLQALSWLQLGIDVPWADEWRPYIQHSAGSFSLPYLFEPENNTLYPVGKVLDALAQRLLNGNVVAYELVSMIALLLTLLAIQSWLVERATSIWLVRAIAGGLMFFMFRAGTYWGTSDGAYQLGIPIVCVLAIIAVASASSAISPVRLASIAVLAGVAGLTHISGAFSDVALALAFLLIAALAAPAWRKSLGGAALVLGIVGGTTSAWQVAVSQTAATPLATPFDPKFWLYSFGLVGGSLWRAPASPGTADTEAIAIALLAVLSWSAGTAAALVSIVRNRPIDLNRHRLSFTLVACSASVASYVALVAAGRAYYQASEATPNIQILLNGMAAHRPFWVTAIWPWVGIACVALPLRWTGRAGRLVRLVPGVAIALAALALSASYLSGAFDFRGYYTGIRELRATVLDCLINGLNTDQPLRCQQSRPDWDLSIPVVEAMANDVSFTHYLRFVHDFDAPGIFRLTTASSESLTYIGATPLQASSAPPYTIAIANDAAIDVSTGGRDVMSSCHILEVGVNIETGLPAVLHIFWSPPDAPQAQRVSTFRTVSAGSTVAWFDIASAAGFRDRLRLHFLSMPQEIVLDDMTVRCRFTH